TLLYYGNSAPPPPPPACDAPMSISESGVTATTATLSWSEVSGAWGYEYALTTSSMPPASTTSTMETTVNMDTLSGNTEYYFHIRTSCDDGNYSDWAVHTFTTDTASGITGINGENLKIYPNPATGIFYLSEMPGNG